jgi:hypothetical protein
MEAGGSYTGGKAAGGVKLTTYFHLVPRIRMRGAIPPLPEYVFTAWCLVRYLYLYNAYFKTLYD